MVRSSRIFQLTSIPLGCEIQQAILLVNVCVSVDGAKLLTVSTTFLLFYNLISKIAHIRMTDSKGRKLMAFRMFCVHCEYLLFYCDMQRVRSVQGYMAVLHEPAVWCYIYIKKHNFMNKIQISCSIKVMSNSL